MPSWRSSGPSATAVKNWSGEPTRPGWFKHQPKTGRTGGVMGRLEGKVAIVTGAASGIGRASASLFAREGARLVIVDQNAESLNETARAIARDGGTVQAFAADIGREENVKAYVDRALEEFGGLDVVYANAGISGGFTPLFEQTVEYWQQILADQSDRPVSRHQTRRSAYGGERARLDRAHRLGCGPYAPMPAARPTAPARRASSVWRRRRRPRCSAPACASTRSARA